MRHILTSITPYSRFAQIVREYQGPSIEPKPPLYTSPKVWVPAAVLAALLLLFLAAWALRKHHRFYRSKNRYHS